MNRSILLLSLAIFGSSACSSIHTSSGFPKDEPGLVYFLPKRDILLTVVVAEPAEGKSKITSVTLGTTPAYPDLTKYFVLGYGVNFAGKNVLDVAITESGLLDSTKSTTQSGVSEALTELAGALGATQGVGAMRNAELEEGNTMDCDPGTHTFTFPAARATPTGTFCGLSLTIDKMTELDSDAAKDCPKRNGKYSGIYYRQNLPYTIKVSGAKANAQGIVFSPSEAPARCLPVSKTFFANNDAEFGFKDGVLINYKQDSDGEVIALLKLPADVIGAYFAALGSVFDSFKETDSKEATALAQSLTLELAKMKYDACIAAIKSEDEARIKELGC